MMNSVRLYMTNAASSVATRILQVTVLVWANQYLLRRIAPEEYSIFPIVLSVMVFADVLRHLIIGGIARFIVEADSHGDDTGVTRIVSSMFPIVLLAGFIFAMAGGIATWKLDGLFNIESAYLPQARLMLLLLTFSLCVNVVTAPFSDGPFVRQRFVALNLIDLGTEALRIVILLVLLFGVSTKVMWLVVASASASTVNAGIRIYLSRRWVPAIHFRADLFCMKTARTLLRFGSWTSIQGITGLVASTAPVLLLNRFGTSIDVAAFAVGRLPENHIRALASVAASPAQPALTRIYAKEGAGALNDFYYRGGRYHLWLTLMIVAPLLIFGKQIISLYAGTQYVSAASVIFWLLAAYPFLWASAMFFQVAHAIGKVGAYYVCDVVVQTVTLLALCYTVGYRGMGAPGAAIATGLAGAALHVFLIWPMGLRLVKGRWNLFFRQTLISGIFPFLAALVACCVLNAAVDINSWLLVGVASAIALAVYVAVLLLFCLDATDRDLVNRLVARIKRTFAWTSNAPEIPCNRRV
jgi:O-antigen/teichoic acid export membrane protein